MGIGIVIIIVFTIFPLIFTGAFKRVPNQKKVKGILQNTNYDKKITSDGMYCFQYVVDGKEYLLKSKKKGSIIKYNSKNPKQAIICPDIKIYIFAFICFIIGTIVIGYSIINDSKNDCCTCLDCPMCDVCCDCNNPYLNK